MEKTSTRVQENLEEKRRNLAFWWQNAPQEEKELRLGPAAPEQVEEHLEELDHVIEKAARQTLGICVVCNEPVENELLEMDYTAQVCLDHLSQEEASHLEYELELSQIVQKAMLPQGAPQIPGVEVAAMSRPAQIVAGDFFDFFRFRDGRYGFMIADVAGKGMSAGMIMASVQTAMRALAPTCNSPTDMVNQLNRLFVHNIHFSTFVTLFIGAYDPTGRILTYCNAGHVPPAILHNGGSMAGQLRWLRPSGAAVGLIDDLALQEYTLQLTPGDSLLLYTDGVTEAYSPSLGEYGFDRLARAIVRTAGFPPRAMVQGLRQELEVFMNGMPANDDTTIIACRIT